MAIWTALALALVFFVSPAGAGETRPTPTPQIAAFSAVVLSEADLRDDSGTSIASVQPYDVFPLIKIKTGKLLVHWQDGKNPSREAWLASNAGAVVLGSPAEHGRRLSRLRGAVLPAETKTRLMAGRISEGDAMWHVEMAWGMPQRSFMVNYISDEQHFVYLTPKGKPVLLRFVAGALKGPLPGSTRAAAAQVESPSAPR